MTDWLRLPIPGSYADLESHYGDPHATGFADKYLVTQAHTIAGGKVVQITSHIALAVRLHNIFLALQNAGKVGLIHSYDGCYVLRDIRGIPKPSLHSWGLAIDLNAEAFPLGSTARQDPFLVKCFADQGLINGADFSHRKDPMHFQLTMPKTI